MLSSDGDAVVLAVRVKPRAAKTRLGGERAGRLLVEVSAPPVDDRANEAVCKLLAKTLRTASAHVVVAAGRRGRDKLVRIEGLSLETVAERLGVAS